MQQSVKSPKPGGNAQVQTVMITAITLFALSGAILGFAVGAFTHQHSSQPTTNISGNNKKQTPVVVAKTPKATTTTVANTALPIGCPAINAGVDVTGTAYTVTLQTMDKTGVVNGKCKIELEKPVTANGITCRIWLENAKDGNPNPMIDAADEARFKDLANLTSPFPHEISNGLVFDSTTSQTQTCAKGLGTWKVSLSPDLPKGNYVILGLTNWNGTYYNYSWSYVITVKEKN